MARRCCHEYTLASSGAALRTDEPDPMSPAPSQLKQLQRELASGQVVVVVGSGVAVAACGQQLVEGHQVASWSGLLEHGVERLSGIGAADGDAGLSRPSPPAPRRPRPAGGPASRRHKHPVSLMPAVGPRPSRSHARSAGGSIISNSSVLLASVAAARFCSNWSSSRQLCKWPWAISPITPRLAIFAPMNSVAAAYMAIDPVELLMIAHNSRIDRCTDHQ